MRILVWFLTRPLAIAVSVCAGALLADGVRRLLPLRKGRLRHAAPVVLFWVTMQTPSWVGDENVLFLFPFFLLVFWKCYAAEPVARLVLGAAFYTLTVPFNIMIDTAGRWGFDLEGLQGTVMKAAFGFLVWLLLKRLAQDGGLSLSGGLWTVCGLLTLSPLAATLSFSVWGSFGRNDEEVLQAQIAYTILPFALLSAAALLLAMTALSRQRALENTARLAGMRELYYEGLRTQQEKLRMLRHDLRNHLTALQGLLADGNVQQARRHLEELTQSPALHGARRICENETANVVLCCKAEAMREHGLTADFLASLPAGVSISDADLCALLGNALDNAMEAAAAQEDKTVRLRLRADRGMLMLRVENACGPALRTENGRLATTKRDKSVHGFGLSGMREIALRYSGTLSARAENGRFELVACLPLSGKAEAPL